MKNFGPRRATRVAVTTVFAALAVGVLSPTASGTAPQMTLAGFGVGLDSGGLYDPSVQGFSDGTAQGQVRSGVFQGPIFVVDINCWVPLAPNAVRVGGTVVKAEPGTFTVGDSVAWEFFDNSAPGSLEAGAVTPDVAGGTVASLPPEVSVCNLVPAHELIRKGNFTLHIG